ncbi:hypothetical protein [Frateuria soli]|uniref:hypothetical protein n=1 Tax=Frateuria soli TaxID=1542730 RepID=UPI001E5597FC|nr:hypothetical protein [Frateuria soli]UGB39282.1 hypothetical protein LQ771_05400 [Frateuria soli]
MKNPRTDRPSPLPSPRRGECARRMASDAPIHRPAWFLLLSLTWLASCTGQPRTFAARQPASAPVVVDAGHGFAITVPTGMHVRHDFQRNYLGSAAWKSFAGEDGHGEPVLALVLDGSSTITAAELRIGVGDDAVARAHCLDVPASGVPPRVSHVTLAGVAFTRFHAADAAMSHYLDVEAYRAIHDGRCYAIDLLVTGTRPEVYDPPATPPFQQEDARQHLRDALAGFRFL